MTPRPFLNRTSLDFLPVSLRNRYSVRAKSTESKFSNGRIFYLCAPFRLTGVIFSGKQSVLLEKWPGRRHKKDSGVAEWVFGFCERLPLINIGGSIMIGTAVTARYGMTDVRSTFRIPFLKNKSLEK